MSNEIVPEFKYRLLSRKETRMRPKRRRLYKNAKNLKRTGGYFFKRFLHDFINKMMKCRNLMPTNSGRTLRMRRTETGTTLELIEK